MTKYKWKQYSTSIPFKGPQWLAEAINTRAAEIEECDSHWIGYKLFSDCYRKYRRGRNRCKRCGLKLVG